jgi:5,10-methylenetetrahydrofolate reductase
MTVPTTLSRKMGDNKFVITAELAPPHGSDMGAFLRMAEIVAPHVDAINVTDNQGANMRMSPLTAAAFLVREGLEPIMQITCRDRNRLALQSDLLGASAMGIHNILALTGDHIGCGDHGQGRAVFDLDSVLLLQTIQGLNEGRDINGKPLDGRTTFFVGAAAAPEVEPFVVTRPKLAKKARAGASFYQTQAVFDPQRLGMFCSTVEPMGSKVIAGILVLRSVKMAEFINRNIPGLKVPPAVVERLARATDPAVEGLRIAIELAKECRTISHGIHLMAMGRDEVVADIVSALK